MKYLFLLLTFAACNLSAQLKVEFSARKDGPKLLFVEQVVEDTSGVITITRIPIQDSLVAVNWIKLNEERIDSFKVQIAKEYLRLDESEEKIKQEYDFILRQRAALKERELNDQKTKEELGKLRMKL
jgi:hypothetical protein